MGNQTINAALGGDEQAAAACTAAGVAIPCGHCGGEARLNLVGLMYKVWCNTCGLQTRYVAAKDDALAAWNRRVRMEEAAEPVKA